MSSEDQIDTSDECMDVDIHDKFIADCAAEAERSRNRQMNSQCVDQGETSHARKPDRGEEAIHEAEASKARMFGMPGNENLVFKMPTFGFEGNQDCNLVQQYSTVVDENYLVIWGHLDGAIQNKIITNMFILHGCCLETK